MGGRPIRQEHPEWFFPRKATFARIDLTRPDACEYLKREISRLVDTYQLAWMKIDFNFELGRDGSGPNCRATTRRGTALDDPRQLSGHGF